MARHSLIPGSFRMLVGNTNGSSDPSRNIVAVRTLSGFQYQPVYYSGNTGTPYGTPGGGSLGQLSSAAASASTASFTVDNSVVSSTGYLQIETNGIADFILDFAGVSLGTLPIAVNVTPGIDSNATADAVKVAADAGQLVNFYTTTVSYDTPVAGQARVAFTANKLGDAFNNLLSVIIADAGVYQVLDGDALNPALTTRMTGGSNTASYLLIGDYKIDLKDLLESLPGVFTTYPVLLDDVATREALATAFAAAISRLPGFSASAVGAVVSVNGPSGPDGGTLPFRFFQSGIANFTAITPSNYLFAVGTPTLGAPVLT